MSESTNPDIDATITVEERRFYITTPAHLEAWRENQNAPLAGRLVVEYVPVVQPTGAAKVAVLDEAAFSGTTGQAAAHTAKPRKPAKKTTPAPAPAPAPETSGDTPSEPAPNTPHSEGVTGGGDATGEQKPAENPTEGESNDAK